MSSVLSCLNLLQSFKFINTEGECSNKMTFESLESPPSGQGGEKEVDIPCSLVDKGKKRKRKSIRKVVKEKKLRKHKEK